MFRNILKRIFDNKPEQDKNNHCDSGISEPVYEIVRVFKAKPSRFKFKFIDYGLYWEEYSLTDMVTGEVFNIKSEGNFYRGISDGYIYISHPINFSQIETAYLFKHISPYIQKRITRIERMYDLIRKRYAAKEGIKQQQLRADLYKKLSESG